MWKAKGLIALTPSSTVQVGDVLPSRDLGVDQMLSFSTVHTCSHQLYSHQTVEYHCFGPKLPGQTGFSTIWQVAYHTFASENSCAPSTSMDRPNLTTAEPLPCVVKHGLRDSAAYRDDRIPAPRSVLAPSSKARSP